MKLPTQKQVFDTWGNCNEPKEFTYHAFPLTLTQAPHIGENGEMNLIPQKNDARVQDWAVLISYGEVRICALYKKDDAWYSTAGLMGDGFQAALRNTLKQHIG